MPNYHNGGDTAPDSLYVFVVAQEPTTGTITYTNNLGQTQTRTFTITDPQQIFLHRVHFRPYELFGYNNSGTFVTPNENEQISLRTFRITTDKDVAVYALNQALTTSDATLVLPVTSLGTEYYVMSYYSDGVLAGSGLNQQYTPSQFVVVGVEDGTEVTIYPTAPTTESGLAVKRVQLGRGQAFLVQAEYSRQNLNYDLTGTRIVANKPVAVFAGHQRSLIPVNLRPTLLSRDHLYEQMIPRSLWGTAYIVTPLADPEGSPSGSPGTDLYRVLASENNTEVKVNNQTVAVLQRGQFYQAPLQQPALVETNQPVMVALFKRSFSGDASLRLGDPFMMIIPPRRQYLNRYRFQSCQVRHPQSGSNTYQQQFITVVTATNNTQSIFLDSVQLQADFKPVPNTCYVYANVRVNDGAHTIESPRLFGLYVYGYGYADSYGYVGGMASWPDLPEVEVSAGPDRQLCLGDSITLSVTGNAVSVRWSVAPGYPRVQIPCDTCLQVTIAPNATTKLLLVGYDSLGCSVSDEVLITVYPKPTLLIRPDTVVCSDSPVTIVAEGNFQSIQWTPTTGLSCSVCPQTMVQPQPGSEIVYTAIVRNANSEYCETRDSIRVRFAPGIAGQLPPIITLCHGDSVTLTLHYGGTIRWTPTTGVSCPTCTTVTLRPHRTTRYTVYGDSAGCTTQAIVEVRVVPKPTLEPLQDTSICHGDNLQLALQATGWGQIEISPAVEVSCTGCLTPVFTPTQTRTYRIRLIAGGGGDQCSVEDSITITVLPRPTISIDESLTLCAGDTGLVVVQVQDADQVEWNPPEGLLCSTCDSVRIVAERSRMYTVTARTLQGCSAQATLNVTVRPRPMLQLSPSDTTVCEGIPVQLHAISNGERIEWDQTVPLSCYDCDMPTYIAHSTSTIHVRSVSSEGCSSEAVVRVIVLPVPAVELPDTVKLCIGKTVQLQPSTIDQSYRYQWSPSQGLSCYDCAQPVASPQATTQYILITRTADGCIDQDSVLVNVVPCRRVLRGNVVNVQVSPYTCDTSVVVVSLVNPSTESDEEISVEEVYAFGSGGTVTLVGAEGLVIEGPATGQSIGQLPRLMQRGERWEYRFMVVLASERGELSVYIRSSAGDTTMVIPLSSTPQVLVVRVLPVTESGAAPPSPGESFHYRIAMETGLWSILGLRSIAFKLRYPVQQLGYTGRYTVVSRPDLQNGQWNFTLSERVDDKTAELLVIGSGAEPLGQNGDILSIEMQSFLGISYVLHPNLEVELPQEMRTCVRVDTVVEPLVLQACGDRLRFVSISVEGFGLRAIRPNPSGDVVRIDYEVGFRAPVEIELVDEVGRLVRTIVEGQHEAGGYELEMNVEQIAAGMYWCRYRCAGVVDVLPLLIVK